MKKKEVQIFINSTTGAEFWYNGVDSLEGAIEKDLKSSIEYDTFTESGHRLLEKIKVQKVNLDTCDYLFEGFINTVTMDFNFASELKLFDIISGACFSSECELGKILVELVSDMEVSFIVNTREFLTPDRMRISFEVCHSDYDYDLKKLMIKGEV
jgi:hypothetical protein